MTPRDVDRKARAQLRTLADWTEKAHTLIVAKVADSRAHATVAVTDTLKRTPDGRRTLRKAAGSPSCAAAVRRLDELWTRLCGPSTAALDGLLRDAREALYREAVDLWVPFVPPEMLVRADPRATVADVWAARVLVLHGMELRAEVGAPIARAKRGLLAAVALAGQRSTPDKVATDILKAWERKTADAVFASAKLVLSDSLGALDVAASRDVVKPEFRDERVVAGGA